MGKPISEYLTGKRAEIGEVGRVAVAIAVVRQGIITIAVAT